METKVKILKDLFKNKGKIEIGGKMINVGFTYLNNYLDNESRKHLTLEENQFFDELSIKLTQKP